MSNGLTVTSKINIQILHRVNIVQYDDLLGSTDVTVSEREGMSKITNVYTSWPITKSNYLHHLKQLLVIFWGPLAESTSKKAQFI